MSESTEPMVARTSPCAVQVEKDQSYTWCACGRSQSQPFCDGSHQGTGLTPVRYTATRDEWLWFCGCKHSKTPPFCDGTHKTLSR